MTLTIAVAEAPVDEGCRRVMQRLVAQGCNAAGVAYSVEPFQFAETDLRHLLSHGEVYQAGTSLVLPVLQSVQVMKEGADVGKISFVLAVNLT
jgi:hypothetical protein